MDVSGVTSHTSTLDRHQIGWFSSLALYSGGARFECLPYIGYSLWRFPWFYRIAPGKCRYSTLIKSRSHPFKSFPIHHSFIILQFNAVQSVIQNASSKNPTPKMSLHWRSYFQRLYYSLWENGSLCVHSTTVSRRTCAGWIKIACRVLIWEKLYLGEGTKWTNSWSKVLLQKLKSFQFIKPCPAYGICSFITVLPIRTTLGHIFNQLSVLRFTLEPSTRLWFSLEPR
jgi:hypothetical protein